MSDIHYLTSIEGIRPEQLGGFFVGWPKKPSPDTLLRLLHNSGSRIVALDGDKVVGFITAITDGILSAYIPFLEVLPAYQGHGIGSELIQRMLTSLDGLYMVDLMCDPTLQSLYEKFGMKKTVGMSVRRFERQDGA